MKKSTLRKTSKTGLLSYAGSKKSRSREPGSALRRKRRPVCSEIMSVSVLGKARIIMNWRTPRKKSDARVSKKSKRRSDRWKSQ